MKALAIAATGMNAQQTNLEVIVNKTGQVFARIDGQADLQNIGQLTLATFANEAGLAPLGDNLFQETTASGPANVGVPGDPGYATIQQGYLENSNVDPVKEITELISAQRAYEMNSKVIQAADDMASVVSKNIR
jgi:flagellar basal-body rod protein FlgG